jgi:ABC-2 type transport system permease protein
MSERGATTGLRTGPSTGLRTGIYDLGYRRYEGARLGRSYAVLSLYLYTLRAIFGLGRSAMSKVFPIGLAIIASVPALIQLAVAAVAPENFEYTSPQNYFGFVSLVLALFCAVAAPEVIGRDQRNHTLSLYFSRSLSRADYVTAKLAALGSGVFLVLVIPQALLLAGNAVSTDEIVDYMKTNVDLLPPILGSAILIGTMMSGVSLAIGSQTPRRAWATGAVIAYFVIAAALGSILFETLGGEDGGYALLLSPFAVLNGAVSWIFSVEPEAGGEVAKADLAGAIYFLAATGYCVLSLGLLYRRFIRMAV